MYDDVRAAHEAAHGLSRAETRAGPCTTQPVPNRAERQFAGAIRYFPESKLLLIVHTLVPAK